MSVHSRNGLFPRLLILMGIVILGGLIGINILKERGLVPQNMEEWGIVLRAHQASRSGAPLSAAVDSEDNGHADEIVVPIVRQGRQLFVQAELDHFREAMLLIDTGATETILSMEVAMDVGLLDGHTREVRYQTAGGAIHALVTRLDHLRVGEAEIQDVPVAVQEIPGEAFGEGLLGMSFFEHFHVRIDSSANRLFLTPK